MLPKDLTDSEKLFVFRRRLGLTQPFMASYCGVSYAKYRCWERGKFTENDTLPVFRLGPVLKEYEICTIKRRRLKIGQKQVARDIDCETPLVAMMEKGKANCNRLVSYWGAIENGKKESRRKATAKQ